LARKRLRDPVHANPTRLDLREQLAAMYREIGEPSQAGRWSFLSQERTDRELSAFEKAYGSNEPQTRLDKIKDVTVGVIVIVVVLFVIGVIATVWRGASIVLGWIF
jgi:hypothetical protein